MSRLSADRLAELGPGWAHLHDVLAVRYRTADLQAGTRLAAAVAGIPGDDGEGPAAELTLSPTALTVRLAAGGDGPGAAALDLARRVSDLAAEQGLQPDGVAPAVLTIALDTADHAAVAPFWSAVLTGSSDHVAGRSILDPTGQVPVLWFQHTDDTRAAVRRFHLDVYVSDEEAPRRVAAAVAAGGRVTDTGFEPSWTILEDAAGNTACVCTRQEGPAAAG